jgi:cellulose synthase/poly-beta-1,6-N-acetylglucosamine synthase-like glycosyltransferase
MVESLFFWLLITLTSVYVVLHIFLFKGINRLFTPVTQQQQHNISIVIAARNEESSIGKLLESLISQSYLLNNFEIIVVNDRSTDSTAAVVETFVRYYPNVRLINIESNNSDMPHKKNALRLGIAQASFEILAFIDADCIAPKNWLREISKLYTDDVGVVAGYSPYNGERVNSFLRYEEFKNSIIAASAVENNCAFMCTGRNFSYRKSVYNEVGGFEEIKNSISGDDDLFLQLVQKKTQWKIRYMIDPESYVLTNPPCSFTQFVNQRTRHVSASKYYPIMITTAYSCIHIFHLAAVIGFLVLPFISLLAVLVKFNIDAVFIAKGKEIFHEKFSLYEFISDETVMVLYSFFIAPLGFLTTFDWKGPAKQ